MYTYPIILAVSVFAVVLFGLLFLYSFFLGKFVERDSEELKRSKKIVEDAHRRAQIILDEALQKAKEIIATTEFGRNELETSLKSSMKDAATKGIKMLEEDSAQVSKTYESMFQEVKEAFLKQVKETLGKVGEAGELGLQEFKASLKDQQLTSQYYMEKRLNQEFDNAQKEVARYKEEQMRRVEESIDRVILGLAQDILGKAISIEDHEKLIFEALGKAKGEGLFNV